MASEEDRQGLRRSGRRRNPNWRLYSEEEWIGGPITTNTLNQQISPNVPTRRRSGGLRNDDEDHPNYMRTYMNQQIGARVHTRPRSRSRPSVPDEQARPDPGIDLPFGGSPHTNHLPGSPNASGGRLEVPSGYGESDSFPTQLSAIGRALGTGATAFSNPFHSQALQDSSRPEGREELESRDDNEHYVPAEIDGEEDEHRTDIHRRSREAFPKNTDFMDDDDGHAHTSRRESSPSDFTDDDDGHDHTPQDEAGPSDQELSDFRRQLIRQREINALTISRCGFRFAVDDNDVVFGALGLQQDFEPKTMDVIISDRNLFVEDARHSYKSNSYVRFKTDSLAYEGRVGDMILRIGTLKHDPSGRPEFDFMNSLQLYEQTDHREWEKTSQRIIPLEKYEFLEPWPWPVLIDYYTVLGNPDSPQTRYAHMESCLVLRKKSNGRHDHDCQKLDWYSETVDRGFEVGDLLLRVGVGSLGEDPSTPDAPEILGCAELFYCTHVTDQGLGWTFEGREECWLRGSEDAGFDQTFNNLVNSRPGDIWGLNPFGHFSSAPQNLYTRLERRG